MSRTVRQAPRDDYTGSISRMHTIKRPPDRDQNDLIVVGASPPIARHSAKTLRHESRETPDQCAQILEYQARSVSACTVSFSGPISAAQTRAASSRYSGPSGLSPS